MRSIVIVILTILTLFTAYTGFSYIRSKHEVVCEVAMLEHVILNSELEPYSTDEETNILVTIKIPNWDYQEQEKRYRFLLLASHDQATVYSTTLYYNVGTSHNCTVRTWPWHALETFGPNKMTIDDSAWRFGQILFIVAVVMTIWIILIVVENE